MDSLPAALSLVTASVGAFAGLHLALSPALSVFECMAAAAPVGFTISAWLAVFLKSFLFRSSEGLTPSLVWTLCLLQLFPAFLGFKALQKSYSEGPSKRLVEHTKASWKQLRPYVAVLGVITAWFCYIFYTHTLGQWENGFFVGGSTYGDMPFHLNVINSYLHGINRHASILDGYRAVFFADAKLVYPFIPDWHIAVLVGGGSSLPGAFSAVGVALIASFLFLLFAFNLRLTGSLNASLLGVVLTLLAGGIGGFVWLFTDTTWQGLLQVDHILYVVNKGPASILWLSLPAHILLPQRTTQYAYPIALLAMILVLRSYRTYSDPSSPKSKPERSSNADILDPIWFRLTARDVRQLRIAAGLVTGLLPLLQAHSFVAVGIAILVAALLQLIEAGVYMFKGTPSASQPSGASTADGVPKPTPPTGSDLFRLIVDWALYGLLSFALGGPQLLLYTGKVQSHSRFARFEGVWVDQHESGPIPLWLEALGLFVPLNIAALCLLPMSRSRRYFQLGLFAVFVVANVVIFQPWEVDNTKIFYIWVFGASGTIGLLLEKAWKLGTGTAQVRKGGAGPSRRHPSAFKGTSTTQGSVILSSVPAFAWKVFAAGAFFSLILSGFLCVIGETLSFSMMFDVMDVEAAEWIKQNTPIDARIASTTEGTHMRPESALAGRQVLVGYPGWMDSHGMNWRKRNDDILALLRGEPSGRQTALKYNVTHIVVDWAHRSRDNVGIRGINSIARRAASNGRYVIYEVVERSALANVKDCSEQAGKAAADEAACLAQGCEWVPYYKGPWCQVPAVRTVVAGGQEQPPVEDCGWPGIDAAGCQDVGCSWYDGYLHGPWCQYPVQASTAVPGGHGLGGMPDQRTGVQHSNDCGWNSITPGECTMRGCTWTPNVPGPWCVFDPASRS